MQYRLKESRESIDDVTRTAVYMIDKFRNPKAADDFLDKYDEEINRLRYFPFGHRGISIEYRGYEIRIKPFGTYNVFFIVDAEENCVNVLRMLKDSQNWQNIMQLKNEYHF